MKGIVKKIVSVLLLFVIAGLVYACIKSIMEPINFNKQKAYRETVGIQRMKDVRTLQEAFKSVSGHFTASADSLVDFYKNGKMEVIIRSVQMTTLLQLQLQRNSRSHVEASPLNRCMSSTRKVSTSYSPSQAKWM